MPSPFPGMDPYLESPEIWPDVHHEHISEVRAALNATLRPRYVAPLELRVYISDDDDPGHWVEIDLLRTGVPSVTDPPLRPSDYRIMISRGDERMRTRFWPIGVRQEWPVIRIPLRGKDPEATLDLGAVFRTVYDRAAYDVSVDYRKDPQPPLQGDAKWARERLRARKG